jgi:hypothetical protein
MQVISLDFNRNDIKIKMLILLHLSKEVIYFRSENWVPLFLLLKRSVQ